METREVQLPSAAEVPPASALGRLTPRPARRLRWAIPAFLLGRLPNARNAIGVANRTGPSGPCAESSDQPLLTSQAGFSGPGGPATFTDVQGTLWLAFHAWLAGRSATRTAGCSSYARSPSPPAARPWALTSADCPPDATDSSITHRDIPYRYGSSP